MSHTPGIANPKSNVHLPPDAAGLRRAVESGLGDAVVAVAQLGERFRAADHELALVGGCVRDFLSGRSGSDLDLTTDARPEEILALLRGWADQTWEVGIKFGTVGARRDGYCFEITTYRSEAYEPGSRKPHVAYGESLSDDLARRDFTLNAMAIRLPELEFVDEHRGLEDLAARRLRTPSSPEQSFNDDPLRM
ncbi:MAG: hypothetical protein Q8P61_08665, partial [Candidatus Nanopelagicales bacterium]|nr:hypothetical protein [Candidatus Nanopelagicales bacterium]